MSDESDLINKMRDAKPAWQDRYGLRGPQDSPPTTSQQRPLADFQVTHGEPSVQRNVEHPVGREDLDPFYDNPQDGSGSGTTQRIFGTINGAPAYLDVLVPKGSVWTPLVP